MTGKLDVMSPDAVSALRDDLEERWFARIERAVDSFLSAVIDDAVAAMGTATLTAAADPFAFTNVMSRWYDAVRLLAEDQGQSDAESIKWLLRESSLPERAFEKVSEILAQARDEGWTTYKTKRALSAELIPKESSGRWTSRAAYRGAVSRIARAMGTKSAAELVEDELRAEGLPGKAWVAVMDERTRTSHMTAHGQVVPLDGTFKVGGHELSRPGDPAAPLEETANCRCILVGGRQEDIDMTITASAALSSGWTGIIGMEKSLTGDGRLIADGALTWETPVPLRYVQTDIGAHDGAQVVGVISNIWRGTTGQVFAEGTFDLDSEIGREAARQVAEGLTTGISMDLDDVAFEVHVAEEVINRMEAQLNGDEPDAARKVEDGRVIMQEVRPDDEVHVMKSARVRAATIVAVPAFAEAKIGADPSKLVTDGDTAAAAPVDPDADVDDDDGLDDDDALEEAVQSALEDEGLEASLDQDDPNRASAETEQLNWVDDVGGLPSYIRRIADRLMKGGMTESRAIAVAVNTVKRWARGGSARGDGSGPKVSAKTIAKAAKALAEWEAKKARAKAAGDTIIAAGGPDRPPREWFADPGLTEPTPITVQKDGRVFGHLATWDSCHIANADFCTSPPRSVTDYAYFHTGAIETEDGSEIGVGHLTLDTGHAEQKLRASAAMSHYDNTGTVAADVRAGEDAHGIWVAGSMRAGLSEKKVRAMRSAPLSGDWRRIQGNLELVAALAVNVPGFPIPRPQGLAASGHMQALVASGMLPPRKVRKPGTEGALSTEDLRYLKALARRERKNQAQALAARARSGKVHDFAKKVLAEKAAGATDDNQKEN